MIMGLETEYGIYPYKQSTTEALVDYFYVLEDTFLNNGGRLYLDGGAHPEYSTPECSNPLDAVKWDKAGELLLLEVARSAECRLFKNNTDRKGNFWGCHENYNKSRSASPGFDTFLATRDIITGCGRILGEGYSIRENPYSYSIKDGRFHIDSGDSSMSEVSTFLKLGMTSLALDLDNDGFKYGDIHLPQLFIKPNMGHKAFTNNFRPHINVQRAFLNAAKIYKGDNVTDKVLKMWEYSLDSLEENYMLLSRDLDWIIKLKLLTDSSDDFGIDWKSQEMVDFDFDYHDIDRKRGLFYRLQNMGEINRMVTDEEIQNAVNNPPEDTRAWLRGNLRRKVKGCYDWDVCRIDVDQGSFAISMRYPHTFTKEDHIKILTSLGRNGLIILHYLNPSFELPEKRTKSALSFISRLFNPFQR